MGNQQVKPEDKLKYINQEVNSLRASIRRTRRVTTKATQEAHYQNLVKYSKEASSLKGKVKEKNLRQTQENISNTVTEVLSIPIQERESTLDSAAIETDSFIGMATDRRRSSAKSTPVDVLPMKKSRNNQNTLSKHVSTLADIDLKFKSLKPQIKTAIDNKDSTQLRVHKKTIEVLATDLEMIEIFGETPLGDRKEKLVSSLTSQYQKINSAMKEIRRSRDLDYLVEQNNNTLLRKLEEIRKELGKTDASLKEAVKNDDFSSLQTAKENLVKINQRLSSIEVTDENTRKIKLQMVDQITWLYKYTNDSTKKGSQSDLTKAQANYEDLIKDIASGKNKNKNDIKVKLESLQSFVETIDDVNESDSKKKKQLLNNINDSFSSIGGNGKKEMETVQVNDPKQTSGKTAIDILKEVNHFCNFIEVSIKRVKLSEHEFDNLVRILENVIRSIESTRENIASSKPKLTKKLNHSSPNLTAPSTDEIEMKTKSKTLGNEHKSNEQTDDWETPKNKTDMSGVVMRNEPVFKRDENVFSAVDQIRTQVNYIKEKIGEIEDGTHIKNKLESFRKTLQTYFDHENQTIANNAKLVSTDIQELMLNISNSLESKQIYLYGQIETIQNSYEHLRKIIEEFFDKRDSDSFEMIKGQLSKYQEYLANNEKITMDQKDEMLKKFQSLTRIFEKKANIQETFTNLKDRVNRFSGAYKGVLYNKIEKDINKVIIDASEHIDNRKISDEITNQAEKHLKILENRATRDQSFRRTMIGGTPALDEEKIMKLRAEIENIRNDMESVISNDTDSFVHLKSRLDLVTLELDQLKILNENEEQMKIFIQNEVEALKIIVDAKIATALENRNILVIKKDEKSEEKVRNRLDKIEDNLNELKVQVEQFVGTTSDNKYYELDENAIRLILKINDMEAFPEGSEIFNRKLKLMEDAHQCSKTLNRRANETEELLNFERSINDIENNFDHYTKSTKDLEKLAEHIEIVKRDLERTNFNRNLRERKKSCVEQIENVARKISTKTGKEGKMESYSVENVGITTAIENSEKTFTDNEKTEKLFPSHSLDVESYDSCGSQNIVNNDPPTIEAKTKDTYIGSQSFLEDVRQNKMKSIPTRPAEQELNEIEKACEVIMEKIAIFDNDDMSEEYQQLEDGILKLNVRLNILSIERDDSLYTKKGEIEKKVSKCLDYLDKRIQALEMITSIENELEKISRNIDKCTTKDENNALDEKLIDLQVKLGKVHLDDEPNQRKVVCTDKIKKYMKQLGKHKKIFHDTAV